ncbi:CATIP protein, partial [Polyodon spathula]|nr:CATIP protein [Polyodon spathula]
MEVFGIERAVHSKKDLPTMWHFFFLSDGVNVYHFNRVEKEERKPVFETEPLIWVEDMQLASKCLDRKEKLKANHATCVSHHAEVKPEDIFPFAADYFALFSSQKHPGPSFQMSNKANPLMKHS